MGEDESGLWILAMLYIGRWRSFKKSEP